MAKPNLCFIYEFSYLYFMLCARLQTIMSIVISIQIQDELPQTRLSENDDDDVMLVPC